MPLDEHEKRDLKQIAFDSIEYGLKHQRKLLPIVLEDYSDTLKVHGASFVTLEINSQLRGCIGSLEANQALLSDVSYNANAAAFKDPRFPELSKAEFSQIELFISVLSHPKAMTFSSEQHLISQIQPHIDGIILEDGLHRATFLPSVWKSLPETEQFLQHLKLKAGLTVDYWSENMRIFNYQSEYF